MLPFSDAQKESLTKEYAANESRKNYFGYAFSMLFSIVLKLLVDYYGWEAIVPEVLIISLSIVFGALLGEVLTHYIFISKGLSKRSREFRQVLQLTEKKYEVIIEELERERERIGKELADTKVTDNHRDLLLEQLRKVDETIVSERQNKRDELRAVKVT